MRRSSWLALAALAAAATAAAPATAQQRPEQEPEVHVVRPGDTLWDLARRYLGDPFRWPEIFRLNPATVEDPDRIYPAERLRIPTLAARDVARVPPVARGAVPDPTGQQAAPPPLVPTVFAEDRTRRAELRLAGMDPATLPAYRAGDTKRAGLLVPPSEVRPVGVLTGALDLGIVPMEISPLIVVNQRVFLRLETEAVEVGERLHLVRPEREVPPFGRIFSPTGVVEVVALDRGIAIAVVREMFDAIQPGNLVLPLPRPQVPVGVDPAPVVGPEGRVVALARPQPLVAIGDVVFVDLGRGSGVTEGDELLAYLPPLPEPWGVRPEIAVARLQIVRVTERTSAARVIGLAQPALEPGMPVRRVGRMP